MKQPDLMKKVVLSGLAGLLSFPPAGMGQTPLVESQTPAAREISASEPRPASAARSGAEDSSAFLLGETAPLSAAEPSSAEAPFDREALIAQSLDYLDPRFGTVERGAEYPFEGFRQRDFTQPTAVGFHALLLANIVTGDIVSEHVSRADAKTRLNRLADSLLTHQKNLGFQGLMPWLAWDGTKWQRRAGEFGEQVTLGDNLNLSSALGAAIGALLEPEVANDATVKSIRSKLDTFLERQRPGYQFLYKADEGRFRRGWNFAAQRWVGGDQATVDYFGDEFRGGVSFAAVRYGFADSVYASLRRNTTEYTLSTGEKVKSVMPFDGGAFQMLWPGLVMPERESPELNTMLRNFVRIALDHARVNGLPGFLSASYSDVGEYAANAGITALTVNSDPRNERASSLYTLGAAYQIAPEETGAFLQEIFAAYPGLVAEHGLWEGVNAVSGEIVEEQIAANVTSFVLGLAGTGPEHMKRYLQSKGLLERLDALYRPETPRDLIESGAGFLDYSTREGFFAAWTENGGYRVLGDRVQQVLSVFFQKGLSASARDLKLTYRSTTPVGAARLELKEWEKGVLRVRYSIPLPLANTGGAERSLLVELPADLGLLNIDEAVLVIDQGGAPIDLTFTDLSAAPADFFDAPAQASSKFSWGNGVTVAAQGDEYRLTTPSFTSLGTAFVTESLNISGAQLKLRFRSFTNTGRVRIEFKQQTASGVKTRLALENLSFGNTAGKEKELLVNLPLTGDLSDIDEIVLLLDGGTGAPLDLTLSDFDFRLRASFDTLLKSPSVVAWGDGGAAGASSASGLAVSASSFTNAYAAFVQPGDGVNYAGRTFQMKYRSTTDGGLARFEFKALTAEGLATRHVTAPVRLENTGGAERTVRFELPQLLELFNVHEVVMSLSEGSGGPLALTVTQLRSLPAASADLLREASSKTATGSTVTASDTSAGYRIQASRFSSANAALAVNDLDVQGQRVIRLRYKSTTPSGNVKFAFKTQGSSGLATVLQTTAVPLANTSGEEREVLIRLGDNLNLLGVDQVVLQLSGGTNARLDFTVTALEIL